MKTTFRARSDCVGLILLSCRREPGVYDHACAAKEMITTSMTSRPIRTIAHPLAARVCVPGSKSLTARALVAAALADGVTEIGNAPLADDVQYMIDALQRLGVTVSRNPSGGTVAVSGVGGQVPSTGGTLHVGNAGTAARFLTAMLTLGQGSWTVDGSPRLRERPIGDLVDALVQLGGRAEATNGCPPVRVTGSGLDGGEATVAIDRSSQFVSALLLVAPYARNPVTVNVTGIPASRPYINMTVAVMRAFGADVERDEYRRFALRPGRYRALDAYAIEPDASAASYFFAAPAVCGGHVVVQGLTRRSLQGDIGFLQCLVDMGCEVVETDEGLGVVGGANLRGIDVDMRDIPDTAQTLAAIAPFAATPTRIRGIATARAKETDRIAATCTELARLGVRVEEHADGITVHPCDRILPAKVHTYGDHRMAMAFSLIGLRAPGVVIDDPRCVSKTFPNFFDVLETLG